MYNHVDEKAGAPASASPEPSVFLTSRTVRCWAAYSSGRMGTIDLAFAALAASPASPPPPPPPPPLPALPPTRSAAAGAAGEEAAGGRGGVGAGANEFALVAPATALLEAVGAAVAGREEAEGGGSEEAVEPAAGGGSPRCRFPDGRLSCSPWRGGRPPRSAASGVPGYCRSFCSSSSCRFSLSPSLPSSLSS